MTKQWRDILDFEHIYEVSDCGDIRNKRTNLILKHHLDQDGYPRLEIQDKGRRKKANISRLVLSAFLGYDITKPQCNHINGDRADNRLCNLEWVTAKENIAHSWKHLGRQAPKGTKHYSTNLTEEDVIYIRLQFAQQPRGIGNILAEKFKVTRATITDICKYRSWKHI